MGAEERASRLKVVKTNEHVVEAVEKLEALLRERERAISRVMADVDATKRQCAALGREITALNAELSSLDRFVQYYTRMTLLDRLRWLVKGEPIYLSPITGRNQVIRDDADAGAADPA